MSNKPYERIGPYAFADIAKTSILSTPSDSNTGFTEKLVFGSVEVGNSSGGDAKCGFGIKQANGVWKAGQWDDSASASYTDDTTDAQDAGASDFALQTTTQNDGYIIQSLFPFNIVGITVGTAEAGGTTTDEYTFWNGSAWTTLPTLATPDYTGTGDKFLEFLQPATWTTLATGDTPVDTDGLTAGYYAIRYRQTHATGPTTAALATIMWVVDLLDYVEVVGDGKSVTLPQDDGEIRANYPGDIVGYCSTANAANWISIKYRLGY
ncbi:MAG: hypothetical protein ACW99U_17910 [Candidatus Thorarchaeota archaeon]|jgi:hypothetical protein